MKPRIAVVGGGCSAVLFAAHFYLHHRGRADLTIYDRAGAFGRGIAYGTARREHLLNVRALEMSAISKDQDHFVKWLKEKSHPYDKNDFVPRLVFAEYLQGLLQAALSSARSAGCEIDLVSAEVSGIAREGEHFVLRVGGEAHSADAVVLATGNAQIQEPVISVPPDCGYFSSPWKMNLKHIIDAERILILGTGLSMVDTAVALKRSGYAGEIKAVSRHGFLPAVHEPAGPKYPAFLKAETAPKTARGVVGVIRAEAKKAAGENISCLPVIDSLRAVTNDIWSGLPPEEKKKLKKALPYWGVLRHRMAPEIGAVMGGMIENFGLHIVKDKITHIQKKEGQLWARGINMAYQAPVIINCLGYVFSSKLPIEGKGVYPIGPVLAGQYLETTAVPEIREQAACSAADLARVFGD